MLININIRNVEYTDTGESPTWKCLAPNSDIRMKRQSSPLINTAKAGVETAENLIYRFCRLDKAKFGEIKNVTDRMYYTNSYHVHVTEEIDAFSKLQFESQFHDISLGGCISYVEVPDMSKNLTAVEQIINYIYHNIQYAEINTKPDVCFKCGYEGEILLDNDLEWYCPNCGNREKEEMQVMRRTCGYIGSNMWGKGRTQEIGQRVLHL